MEFSAEQEADPLHRVQLRLDVLGLQVNVQLVVFRAQQRVLHVIAARYHAAWQKFSKVNTLN
jgi:hypothetical protein